MPALLIYIHGFTSSGQSEKAQSVGRFIAAHQLDIEFLAPDFSNYPGMAYQQICQLVEAHQQLGKRVALMGSSLGGFMATVVAERYQLRAVLINPAVYPHELLPRYLGDNYNLYTGEHFFLTEAHMNELKEITCDSLAYPKNYWLLLQTADETLDYRRANTYYHQCQFLVEQGGNHRFENFEQHIPTALHFLHLT